MLAFRKRFDFTICGQTDVTFEEAILIMSIRWSNLALAVVAAALAVPAMWAADMDVAHVTFNYTMTLDDKTIQPGDYEFRVKPGDTNVEIVSSADQKVIATVSGKWITLKSKAPDSEVLSAHNRVEGVQFGGQTDAIQFPGSEWPSQR